MENNKNKEGQPKPQNPEWPTKNGTDNPSGKNRGNNPPKGNDKPQNGGNSAKN